MAKDPAFLFYPNDWIGGTMGMTFEEKGAYMEVLMMQFNRGHMTEHMIGLMIGHLWVKIMDKFEKDDDGLWYNSRLDEEKQKRQKYVKSRQNNKSGANQYEKIQKNPVGHMTSHMENEDIIYIDILNTDIEINENDKNKFRMVVVEMYKIWQKYNPIYPKDETKDYHALLQLAYKIAENKKWSKSDIVSKRQNELLTSWDKICGFIMSDGFLKDKPLSTCANQWQKIFMGMLKNKGTDHLEAKRVLPEDYFTNK